MSKKEQSKVWFITGISRGFGRELASAALERGDVVIGTSRNGKSDIVAAPERFYVFALDVTHPKDVVSVVTQAWQIRGQVDVVVNNATSLLSEDLLLLLTGFRTKGPWPVETSALGVIFACGNLHMAACDRREGNGCSLEGSVATLQSLRGRLAGCSSWHLRFVVYSSGDNLNRR